MKMFQTLTKLNKLTSRLNHITNNESGKSTSSKKPGIKVRDSLFAIKGEHLPTGTFTGLILSGFCLALLILPILFSNTTYADSSITITIDDSTVDLNIGTTNINGTFSKSNPSTISVTTTNGTGYTLGIRAGGANPTELINDQDATKTLTSVSSPTTEEQFKALASTSYNGKWGYLPSKYCTGDISSTCNTNTSFLVAPTTIGDTLDITETANPTVANTYELTLGARVDSTQKLGAYSNTYVVYASANPIPYSIIYYDNVISDMPVDIATTTMNTTEHISNNTPTRTGYTFLGWCPGTVTHNANGTDTCSTTALQPGATISINQIDPSQNNYTLYAMWSGNYTIGALTYLQDFASLSAADKLKIMSSMTINEQYRLKDRRDNKDYWIALLDDGNIWMTQGLDLDLANGTILNHAYSDIGWSENNTSKTWNPQSTANTINFEGGSGTTVSGWTNDNDIPYSASPYYISSGNDVYVLSSGNTNADTITNLSSCTTTYGKTAEECSHYKVGNYYNFAAANATNSVSNTVGHTVADTDNGFVMPDSICPAGWRLPHGLTGIANNGIMRENNSEFDTLLYLYGVTANSGATKGQNIGYASDGLNKVRIDPLYFVRSGYVLGGTLYSRGTSGYSWSSTISATSLGYLLAFSATNMYPADNNNRFYGFPVRCIVR